MLRLKVLISCLVLFPFITLISAQSNDEIVFVGLVDDETPYVEYTFANPETRDVHIDLAPNDPDSNLDTLLYLVDNNGNIIAENDDRSRHDRSSFITYRQLPAGQYTIISTRYGVESGRGWGEFALRVSEAEPQVTETQNYSVTPETLRDAGFPDIAPQDEAEWTILAYYGGDTNLEPGIINDLNEFELAGGSTNRVRVVLLLDRHPQFTDSNGDWASARIFEIGADASADHTNFPRQVPTIDTTEITDLGEIDTGSGETLAQFLTWGIQNYPARHYAVAFASHGSGWQGLITDETDNANILSIPELQKAFAIAKDVAGVNRFDLLINDACNMSSIEYHTAMSDYFNYSLASSEIVTDPALDMTTLTQMLAENESVDYSELGKALVDIYIERDAAGRAISDYFNYAMTDLTAFDPVTEAVENFATVVNSQPVIHVPVVGQARARSYAYASFTDDNPTLIDLGDFMRNVVISSSDVELVAAAQDTIHALELSLVYSNGGERVRERSSYYNIYFPEDSRDFKLSYFDESTLPTWGQMLRNYYNYVTPQLWTLDSENPFHPPVAPQVRIADIYPVEDVSVVTGLGVAVEIVGRNLAQIEFLGDRVEPDGTVVRLGQIKITHELSYGGLVPLELSQGVNRKTFFWDGAIFQFDDGVNQAFASTKGDLSTFFIEGQYRQNADADWEQVSIVFGDQGGAVQQVISRQEGNNALASITIPEGSEFQMYREIVDDDGRTQRELYPTVFTWSDDVVLNHIPAPDGEYIGGYLVSSFGGTLTSQRLPITVKNSSIDPNLRPFMTTYFGITTAYPLGWLPNAEYSPIEEDPTIAAFSRAVHPNGRQFLTYYPVLGGEAGLEGVTEHWASLFGFELTSEIVATELDNTEAVTFSYAGTTDDGYIEGIAYVVNRPNPISGQIGMVMAAEGVDGEGIEENIYLIEDYVKFFDPITSDRDNLELAQWYTDEISSYRYGFELQYPIHKTFLPGRFEEIWRLYAPFNLPGLPPIFAAVTRQIGEAEAVNLALFNEYVVSRSDELLESSNRLYHNGTRLWHVTEYERTRINATLTTRGRLYTTQEGLSTYAMWFEAPINAPSHPFQEIFEPMLDGFDVKLTTYESPKRNYSLQFPDFWSDTTEIEGGLEVSVAPGGAGLLVIGRNRSIGDARLQIPIMVTFAGARLTSPPREVTLNDGVKGYRFASILEQDGISWQGEGLAFVYDGELTIISVNAPDALDWLFEDLDIFAQIIESLQFH